MLFKSRIFVSYRPLAVLYASLTGLQCQTSGSLCSKFRTSSGWGAWCGAQTSCSLGSVVMIIPLWVANTRVSEKAMAPHSSTLAWKIPWMEEPGRLQSMGSLESDTTERLHFDFSLLCIGEGNGNLLQCSCLENPRDGGALWAAVSGVAQSQTRLKRLSSSSRNTRV